MKKEMATIGLVIGVLLIAAVSVPMVAAGGGVTRTLPGTASPGSTITVSLDVEVDGATNYAIDEQVPAGWNITSASGGGDFVSEPGHVKWLVLMGAVDTTLTYTVSIPATAAGAYTFTGIYMLEDMAEEANIGGDSSITVTIADTTQPVINFIAPTPADDSTVTVNYVTINVNVTDSSGVSMVLLNWNGVNETMYMTGLNTWSVNKTNLPDGNYIFKVYANDSVGPLGTVGNMGVSETRTVIVSAFKYDPADTNHDREISMPELVTAIGWWKAGTPGYGIAELMTTIARWKAGGY